MNTTRASLLARVRRHDDNEAWQAFLKLYGPLLYCYARKRGLADDDSQEVRDQCLEAVSRHIAEFEYDRDKGGFKAWLRRIAENKTTDLIRQRRPPIADTRELCDVADAQPTPAEIWEQQWRIEHLRHCVDQAAGFVSETQLQVFEFLLFESLTVPEICSRLGITPNQVYKAKARVLEFVRRELAAFE